MNYHFVFFGSLIGVSLIVLPLAPEIQRLWWKVKRKLDAVFGVFTIILRPQPFAQLVNLEKYRTNRVRTYRLLLGYKGWAILLIREKLKDTDD